MRFDWLIGLSLLAALALPASGCSKSSGESGTKVAQVVFLDQEEICPITKKGINKTWDELQVAVKGRDIRVMRVYQDTQGSLARKYTQLKPTVFVPGIYFLTEEGELVEHLQGEKKAPQITEVLDR
jgi:hypothetical protein